MLGWHNQRVTTLSAARSYGPAAIPLAEPGASATRSFNRWRNFFALVVLELYG
jgi:hypothetical protein